MKNFIRKLLGIDQLESMITTQQAIIKQTTDRLEDITVERDTLIQQVNTTPLTEKEVATANKEPWVTVVKTHVNNENASNGFFELDWNEYFISRLRGEGYTGSSDEEIVDQWFSSLCKNIGDEQGIDMENRGRGFVNVNKLDNGRSEIG